PESQREAEREHSTDEEVHNLHPSLVAQTERTPVVVPRAITRACGTLDQKHDDKKRRANRSARDQERGHRVPLYRMIFFCLHGRILLVRRPVSALYQPSTG